jgi:hypothetical protein
MFQKNLYIGNLTHTKIKQAISFVKPDSNITLETFSQGKKLAKTFSYYLLCFLFTKIGEQEGGTGYAQKWGVEGGDPNNVYTCE